MFAIKLVPTLKADKWFRYHKLNIEAMEYALSVILNTQYKRKKLYVAVIKIGIHNTEEFSRYWFGGNIIKLSRKPYYDSYTRKEKVKEIFGHFLHEFRHWMQSRVYGYTGDDVNYTSKDVDNLTKAYTENKCEVDANKFYRKHIKQFTKYYNNINRQLKH